MLLWGILSLLQFVSSVAALRATTGTPANEAPPPWSAPAGSSSLNWGNKGETMTFEGSQGSAATVPFWQPADAERLDDARGSAGALHALRTASSRLRRLRWSVSRAKAPSRRGSWRCYSGRRAPRWHRWP